MKKTARRALCLVLAFTMLFSVMSVSAGAEEQDEFLYVYLGNSTAQGYKLFDHTDTQYRKDLDTDATSAYSTIRVFADYLAGKVDNLHMRDLSLTGMRSAELRAILDPEYFNSGNTDDFLNDHMGYYTRPLPLDNDTADHPTYEADKNDGYGSYENLNAQFTDAITNADLIVYDLCTTDFGSYFAYRLLDTLEGDTEAFEDETLANIIAAEGDQKLAAAADALGKALWELLGKAGLPSDKVSGIVDAILYSYACFVVNFDKAMDKIYELNSDADVIVVGPDNIMAGLNAEYNGMKLSMEDIWGIITKSITAHIVAVNSHKNQYKFADLSAGLPMVINDIAAGRLVSEEETYNDVPYCDLYENIYSVYAERMEFLYMFLIGGLGLGIDDPETMICDNMAKAAAITELPIGDIVKGFSDPNAMVIRALLNYDNELETDTITEALEVVNMYADLLGLDDETKAMAVDAVNALYTPTSDADRAMLTVVLRFEAGNGLGGHPSVKGYAQKAEAIEKAYESSRTADGTLLAKATEAVADKSVGFIGRLFDMLLGKDGAADRFKQYVSDLFAPVLKVFKLAGSFGVC